MLDIVVSCQLGRAYSLLETSTSFQLEDGERRMVHLRKGTTLEASDIDKAGAAVTAISDSRGCCCEKDELDDELITKVRCLMERAKH